MESKIDTLETKFNDKTSVLHEKLSAIEEKKEELIFLREEDLVLISVSIVTWNLSWVVKKLEKKRRLTSEKITLLNAVYVTSNFKTKMSFLSTYQLVKCMFVLCAVTDIRD